MHVISCLSGTDPSSHLGRLDYASMPQQALMEMLIDGIENREKICGSKEEPKDIEEWRVVTLIENREVVEINWQSSGFKGRLNLQWLPSTVKKFRMGTNRLIGTLDFASLPVSLVHLNLRENEFTGDIDLTRLPETMEELDVALNKLSGSLDLERLPKHMVELVLCVNKFTGTVNLTKLPEGMKNLYLSRNTLSGSIDVANLPSDMEELHLAQNKFRGETDFSKLPESLKRFEVSETHLSGEIFLEKEKRFSSDNWGGKIFKVDISGVKLLG